ncbi:venom phosphodiesterase 1 isoform X1 [Hippocampus zosterae]|uniref:venom phosphodiesterase 1 isoform X1 n=1 Tax=Hippocampus zosterae TaxID=109293 RepID=UPI00223D8910|nr:venom phosphodiesterase 1 isoform X1 [Hippocampus zosterae]
MQSGGRRPPSSLTASTSSPSFSPGLACAMKAAPNKRKLILLVCVLSVSLVTLILGLGLGLGLELRRCRDRVGPRTSCRNRCYQPYDGDTPGCRCDDACGDSGTCCPDYHDLCKAPAELWECTRLRCGETRLPTSRCHCSDDCSANFDCCSNYRHVCQGQSQWVEDECEDLSRPSCPPGFKRQPLLLVSLDGLRADYLRLWNPLIPVLAKLQKCGASASYMQSSFPTKTFPNHYSIVTGLYPESNGLIDNVMYDPVMDAIFTLSGPEKENPEWYLGQPIWHTAKYQGLKSGTFFWPGSDVKINGSFPDIYRPYNGKIPFEERVLTVLKWLQLPDGQRPDFYTLYLEEPDKSGHSFGPVSGGVAQSIKAVDKVVGQLMNGLKQLGLHRCVNVIVVADHGMEETSCDRKENLQELLGDVSDYIATEGPFGRIRAKNPGADLDAAGLVANMTCKGATQNLRPYLKWHLPKRLHYANSRRIEDVNVLVEPKWLLERLPGSLRFCSGGQHGYDNDVASMHAMFVAHGPKFASGTEAEPFANVELYNLMCDVLQISPAANNGTHGSLNHLLRLPFYTPLAPPEQNVPGECRLGTLQPQDPLACSCPHMSGDDVMAANRRLNMTSAQEAAARRKHLMFGRPRSLRHRERYCILHQEAFVSAYSADLKMALWSSFSVDMPSNSEPLPPVGADCLRADVRIPPADSRRCDDYGDFRRAFLYPPGTRRLMAERRDALLSSHLVPMYPEFHRIWAYFHGTLLKKYAAVYNGVNVLTGPAFDYDHDGRHDRPELIKRWATPSNVSVPTHYFAVLTSCRNAGRPLRECDGPLRAVAFLLPHRPDTSESCKSAEDEASWVEDHIWFHQARVRDVEWITGLDFYQESQRPMPELLRLKTRPTAATQKP